MGYKYFPSIVFQLFNKDFSHLIDLILMVSSFQISIDCFIYEDKPGNLKLLSVLRCAFYF